MASPKQYAEERAALLADRLRGIQDRLDKLTARVASSSETSSTYWKATQVEARRLYEEMRRITRGFMTTSVGTAYDTAIRSAIKDLKASAFAPKTVHYNEFSSSQLYVQGLDSILSESLGAFANGYLSGETQYLRMMRLTQQVNLTEKQVNKAIEDGYIESGSPQGTARRLRDELMAKFEDGKYISIIDKNGETRQYTVDAYAELVARTKLIEATTAGVTQATLAAGGDLVQVSVHNTECAVCAPYEGKIYSLSGSDPDFPAVEELPPYHPQCAHSIDPVFKEFLDIQGTLEDFIAFSNDETDQHPTRTSWVPLSERSLK